MLFNLLLIALKIFVLVSNTDHALSLTIKSKDLCLYLNSVSLKASYVLPSESFLQQVEVLLT